MSSTEQSKTAEQRFREAFERLKINKPQVLKKNTPVTQNNVAKEAGVNPTALKKSRYPTLIREIQAWLEVKKDNDPTPNAVAKKARDKRRDSRSATKDFQLQRDVAASQLISAQQRIRELTLTVEKLRLKLDKYEPPPTRLKPSN